MHDLEVLSLGAGVQSSILALASAKGELPPVSAAIFADTGAEPKSVYTWLDWLEGQLPFPVYRVSQAQGNLAEECLQVHTHQTNGTTYLRVLVPFFTLGKDGERGILPRKCTGDYKIAPIRRRVRSLLEATGKSIRNGKVRQHIGISTDEAHRMRDSGPSYIDNYYPLVEAGWSRSDCLEWAKQAGIPKPPRSACMFCPFHSDKEWMRLRDEEPDAFAGAIQFEKDIRHKLKTTDQLRASGEVFLHSSRRLLSEVEFRDEFQLNLWGNECEGMCGL